MENPMRKFLFVSVLFLSPSPLFAETIEEWTKPSSVRVRKMYGQTADCGSGTVVYTDKKSYLVLTCFHVARPDKNGSLQVQAMDERWVPADVASQWQGHDLALLYVKDPEHKVLASKVADAEEYENGLQVCKCGYPGAGPRDVRVGTSRGEKSIGSDTSWITVSYSLLSRSGDSGGGLFRASDRALIGVVWGGLEQQQLACATHVMSIRAMMKSARENGWIVTQGISKKPQIVKKQKPPQSVLAK
jgi:S1-C subfamily serine protease